MKILLLCGLGWLLAAHVVHVREAALLVVGLVVLGWMRTGVLRFGRLRLSYGGRSRSHPKARRLSGGRR